MNVRHDKITLFIVRPGEGTNEQEFLQLRRCDGEFLAGTWAIVRGGVERGEAYSAAAIRELREETGLSARELYRSGTIESFHTQDDDTLWHSVVFVAIVARDGAVRLNEEHDAFRWTPRSRIESETLWPSERAVLGDVIREILDNGRAKPYLRVQLPGKGFAQP
jgi:ADP-ribose pyrophosphatase YjhB (NUDIX family)